MSELLTLGVSHKTAPVALRERLAFGEEEGDGGRAPARSAAPSAPPVRRAPARTAG